MCKEEFSLNHESTKRLKDGVLLWGIEELTFLIKQRTDTYKVESTRFRATTLAITNLEERKLYKHRAIKKYPILLI